MKNVRSILALALVIAMTFTMLPVFAMADDAAVEDVSVIPEAAPAEAPAAIETAPAEAVAPMAELQALTNGSTSFANDAAAVAAGYFLRLDVPTVGSAWYNSFQTASNDYCTNNKADSAMVLLCDYTYYSDAAASSGIINCSAKDGTGTLTNLTFDLNGFTLTARCKRPVISRGSQCTNWMKFRGGTIFYQNLGETGRRGVAYSNASYPTNNAGTAIMVAATELTDMNVICLAPASGGYATPIFSSNHWLGTVNATDSMLISVAGPAVEFKLTNIWKSDTTAAQINKIKNSGIQNSTVNLYGACVVGTLSDGPAVQFDYPATVTTNELQVGLIVNADDARESVFLGSSIVGVKDDPDNSARLMKILPEDYTATASFALTLPDPATLAASSSYAKPELLAEAEYPAIVHAHDLSFVEEIAATAADRGTKAHYHCSICGKNYQDAAGTVEATDAWLMIPALACDHAAKQYVAEAPATVTETGVREHYFCPNCGKLLDMDGESELTPEALTLPTIACTHPDPEHRPAVPATFLATGVIEYWYCPTCGNLYADESCQTQISEDALATPVRTESDTEGLTDAQLVEYGALAKAVSPEGDVKAYTTVSAAYTEGAQWTAPGGVVTLLQDYTVFNNTSNAAGYFNNGVKTKETNKSWTYDNADANDPRFAGLGLKGFWFDLGGHTIVFRSGYAFFASVSVPLNFRNGTIIYQNTASTAINYGMFKNGTTSVRMNSATEIYRPAFTFDNITILSAERATKAESGSSGNPQTLPIFPMAALQSQVNVIDSTIIASGTGVFRYLKSSASDNGPLDAFAQSHGYQHEINLRGNTVIGTTSTGTANQDAVIYCASAGYGNSGEEADYFNVNVEGDNVVFLGNAIAAFGSETLGAIANIPDDYVLASEGYALTLPNKAAFVNETRAGEAVFGYQSKPTSIPQWVKDADAQAAAKITEGETETYVTSLTKAIKRAEILGRTNPSVTVTLLQDAEITESAAIGLDGAASAFTLDLNGKALTGEGLITMNGGAGAEIAVHVTGTLGGGATEAKFFAGLPALAYAGDNTYVVEKGRYFTNYSLNLEDSVSINLYTDGANGDPDAVGYVQDGKEYSLGMGELHDWVVNTLAAKQMYKSVTVCAVKTEGAATYVDFAKVSVKGYVDSDPAAGETNAAIRDALNATLDTMLIYGKYAEKFFGGKYTALTADELTAIGVAAIPETDTSNLVHTDRVVTGMADHAADVNTDEGFWGTAAVLEDAIGLKFYFCGAAFDGAAATVDGEAAELQQSGDYKFVQAAIAAKDFDKTVTVEIAGVGSVSDSAEAYTARVAGNDDAYNLVQALRAYCADAKRYAEAKAGA